MAFSRDGLIASACGDSIRLEPPGEVKVWDSETSRLVTTLRSRVSIVWSVAFSPDGLLIATGGGERSKDPAELKVWDARTGNELRELLGHTRGVSSVSLQS